MANSKLLKEAIADAKAVRETAIANAKIALEEAFTPKLQSILSKKLQSEMEDEDEDAKDVEEYRLKLKDNFLGTFGILITDDEITDINKIRQINYKRNE